MGVVCEGSLLCLDLCKNASVLALVCGFLLAFVAVLELLFHIFRQMNSAVFSAVQNECALLGMVSFLLFSIPALGARVGYPPLSTTHPVLHEMIEFVHITLFLSTIAYLLVVAALARYKAVLELHWQAAYQQTRTQSQRVVVEQAFRADRGRWFGLGWRRNLAPVQRRVSTLQPLRCRARCLVSCTHTSQGPTGCSTRLCAVSPASV